MFYTIFCELCEKNNISPSKALSELGFSTGNLQKWKNGAKVNSDILISVSSHFGVSIDYLLTGKKSPNSELTKLELEVLDKFNKLLDVDKGRILSKMETIIESYPAEIKENIS